MYRTRNHLYTTRGADKIMKWNFYNNRFYKWLDKDKTGKRWDVYGSVLILGLIALWGYVVWLFGL